MSVTSGTKRKEGGIGETVRVIIHALIIALVIRTFFFQPFNIPSGSMKDTLLVGDYLFVSKYHLRLQQVFLSAVAFDFFRARSRRLASRARGCGGVSAAEGSLD